jgi:hypothetical protein
MRATEGSARGAVSGAAHRSTALRKAGTAGCPSIDIAYLDDTVDYHLIPRIKDLWPRPADPEHAEDLAEALRTDLRVAITEVLAGHRVTVVEP